MPDPNPESREFDEKMAVPEIDFEISKPATWYFIVGEAIGISPDRNSKSESSKRLQQLFAEKPIDPIVLEGLRSGAGRNGEHLFRSTTSALSHESSDRELEETKSDFRDSLQAFREEYPKIEDIVIPEFEQAKDDLESRRSGYVERFKNAVNFFRPKKSTADVKKATIVASGEMLSSLGTLYNRGEEITIFDGGDVETGTHEFLHSIINPLVQKVEFTDEEVERVGQLIPPNVRDNYEQGAGALSETLINAYLRVFTKETTVKEALMSRYKDLGRSEFDRAMRSGSHFTEMMGKIGVKSFSDWTDDKKEEMYRKYFEDGLMERCVSFYSEYEKEREGKPFFTFEDFFQENYRKLLK